jgi:SAM-dependent methyltransferase
VGDLIHSGELYDHVNTFLDDLPFYRRWCEKAGGAVLELCCGTGRLTLPLLGFGIDIMGIDSSDSMITRARDKAAARGAEVRIVKTDIRSFSLEKKFSLIFIPFNSLQCIYTVRDLERVLESVRAHLAPDGLFIFDIFNPSIELMVARKDDFHETYRFELDDGRSVVISERCRYDEARQVNRVKWRFRIDDEETIQNLDMRCYYPVEMDALLAYNGVTVEHKFGRFDETPFDSTSPKQICVCRMGRADGRGS